MHEKPKILLLICALTQKIGSSYDFYAAISEELFEHFDEISLFCRKCGHYHVYNVDNDGFLYIRTE